MFIVRPEETVVLDIVIIVHFSSKNVVLSKLTARASICVLNFIKMKTVCFSERHIGLASADVTAEKDAWKRIATGRTGSKQR